MNKNTNIRNMNTYLSIVRSTLLFISQTFSPVIPTPAFLEHGDERSNKLVFFMDDCKNYTFEFGFVKEMHKTTKLLAPKEMYHTECNDSCATRRFRRYILYGVLFCCLVVLAGMHFVWFLVSRRKLKDETKDYVTRKMEFVAVSLSDLRSERERIVAGNINVEERRSASSFGKGHLLNQQQQDSPTRLPSSCSSLHARSNSGLIPGLNMIEEENLVEMSRCSTSSTSRTRSVIKEAVHEPVIVTVATVSAIFQEEATRGHLEDSGGDDDGRSSGCFDADISDIIHSSGKDSPLTHHKHHHQNGGRGGSGTPSGLYVKKESERINRRHHHRQQRQHHISDESD
ncbi:unnamed protein product [Orchesella dallaii]|uniref:Uncharacterized protein n=1 Tax=Orchesella dallaii TaxID=48710 RepID=A0ABP1RRI6_9HEXA